MVLYAVIKLTTFKHSTKNNIDSGPRFNTRSCMLSCSWINNRPVPSCSTNYLTLQHNMEDMLIERTSNEVIIRLPASVDIIGLQRLIDYLTYKEATSNSKATQEQVNKLSK